MVGMPRSVHYSPFLDLKASPAQRLVIGIMSVLRIYEKGEREVSRLSSISLRNKTHRRVQWKAVSFSVIDPRWQ